MKSEVRSVFFQSGYALALSTAFFSLSLVTTAARGSNISSSITCDSIFEAHNATDHFLDEKLKLTVANNGHDHSLLGYETGRGIRAFTYLFGLNFRSRIEQLGPDDALLDGGCGDACLSDAFFKSQTLSENSPRSAAATMSDSYFNFEPGREPTYIGVTKALHDRPFDYFLERLTSTRFRLLLDRYFEQYNDFKLKQGKKIQVITDFFGILSYTARIDIVMQTYLRLLEPDGVIFIGAQHAVIISQVGDLYGFLSAIDGITFKVYHGEDSTGLRYSGFEVRKTGAKIRIPELVYQGSDYDIPPQRFYTSTGQYLLVEN